jgi:hypothetical protein
MSEKVIGIESRIPFRRRAEVCVTRVRLRSAPAKGAPVKRLRFPDFVFAQDVREASTRWLSALLYKIWRTR